MLCAKQKQMTPERLLQGHAAFVTGAGRGMGRAIALMLAREGCNVALVARNAGELNDTAQECEALGVRALPMPFDLADTSALADAIAETTRTLGRLNVLVNNAGMHQFASSIDADLAMWDALLNVNLRAVMHATRLCLPHILAGTAQGQRGAVIFMSSLGGKFAAPTNPGYAATKHALTGFAGSVFEDVRDHNVKVCALYPGWTNTGLLADWLDAGDAIQPDDVAEAVRFVIRSSPHVCPTEIVMHPQSSKAARLLQ
jgi:NADP-dependent 3-hydroxy acid dehydrogenase YdfG